jgi:hypothetical protein
MLGWGVPRSPEAAVGWYQRAAEQGNAAGLYNLALCYQGGVGVSSDEVHALALLSAAAEQGYAPAMYSLGECHHRGRGGLSASAVAASQWYERAAIGQSAAAALALGQVRTQPHVRRDSVSVYVYERRHRHRILICLLRVAASSSALLRGRRGFRRMRLKRVTLNIRCISVMCVWWCWVHKLDVHWTYKPLRLLRRCLAHQACVTCTSV